jgi:DNA-binding PadR family transcriptional regulator
MRGAYWRHAYSCTSLHPGDAMDRERPIERFLPLRPVEFEILLSLAAGERHGYGIIQDAEARGLGAIPDVGTLYRALRRLQDQGLIGESGRRPAPDAQEERRNYYKLTALGRRVAQGEARRLVALMRAARSSGLLGASVS